MTGGVGPGAGTGFGPGGIGTGFQPGGGGPGGTGTALGGFGPGAGGGRFESFSPSFTESDCSCTETLADMFQVILGPLQVISIPFRCSCSHKNS